MVDNPQRTPDPVITALIQRAVSRRSDLTSGQRASLASIADHRVQTYGRPGMDNLVDGRPAHRRK